MRILYIDVDSLRADHTTPYGDGRDTTPNLARLARRGVRMENYFCSDSPCVPARAVPTTQRFGITTGASVWLSRFSRTYADPVGPPIDVAP